MGKEYSGVLVFAEQKKGQIHNVSYELLGKARQLADKLNAPVYSVLLGPNGIRAEELIYRGADKVFYIEDDIFNEPEELVYKINLVKLIDRIKPEIFLIGATSLGRSLAPRLAAALNTGLTADCTGLEIDEDGKLVQIRPAFSENILAHIKTDTYPQMSTVRYKEFDEAKRNEQNEGEIVKVDAVKPQEQLVKVISELKEQQVDISDASVVVAAGKGLKKAEDIEMIQELADLLGGLVGASRSIVDDGFISKDFQVGYSGNRVKPKIYIACGISGAPQHLAGMKESEFILAINTDPSAPIFNVADYGIVADMYKVIPELINSIKNKN
ncbi:electron transfer flavoprotein subunit alpha/FixB family protein [Clostridium luticellarii]|jgi:electron transfer flavoprotein alpha subunit|uniref:Acryloyl-CoA reductase electron transfer subunit beta n=1 Tax=Clostridium luticellarii TaxID=1691940 RepID=A0A2T0BMA3_9CLOT|nr:electron transfer flavoprotein subunit alpha/FixB family protein [Clostridium luticellarii]MCI1945200.1 electron transfer flavoprotein subunit alpha/FixB family protein [Clostridium luticellarii]MCI1968838.1 electron transfer flavoprotein subunit alpha/FixB family protein [Clostridium luticellarii]MCI1995624.1 electron transfer flavoprotein subunit alpha/FixB family protein [Clostridium luticellarii]MCI2040012.1 electron transfer flavoprotein subunit alpha/FixB family protein [Clostridium lu